MRKRKFMTKKPANEEMALQITSMADIMVILLVFLLKSFSSGISVITPSAALTLPEASSADQAAELLKVEISKDSILIDDKPVTKLNAFAFEKNDIESDGTPRSLNAALIRERERYIADTKARAAAAGQPAPEGEDLDHPKLMIMADQKVPYRILQRVLASAGSTGFSDFKLAVVEDK